MSTGRYRFFAREKEQRYNSNSLKLYECELPTRTSDLLFDEKQPSTGCNYKTCFLRNVKEQQEDKDLEA